MNDATIPFEEKVKYFNGEGNVIVSGDDDILTGEPKCDEKIDCIDCLYYDSCSSAWYEELI